MSSFRVALLQLLPTGSLEGNLEKGVLWCRRAKALGADLALFPEMWSSGYDLTQTPIGRDSVFLTAYRELAKALDMAVAVTYLERYEPLPRNTVTVFDRRGREVLTYAKVHTCDFGDERGLTPGDGFVTAQLDTADVEPLSHVFPVKNVFREDAVAPSRDRAELLACAPAPDPEAFLVPRAVE